MDINIDPRLCFGTFINILAHCKKERITKKELTGTIIQTIDPESTYKDEISYRALNHLYKCTGDFSITYSNILQLAPITERNVVLQQFENLVMPLIDRDKRTCIILALCDLIEKDTTLHYNKHGKNFEKFEEYISQSIKHMFTTKEYVLSEFLTDIFRYTVIETKNIVGKPWLQKISGMHAKYDVFFKEYVNSFMDKKDTIQVWDTREQLEEQKHLVIPGNPLMSEENFHSTIIEATIHIPQGYKMCLYCKNWKGNIQDAEKSTAGTYGKCLLYGKNVISLNRNICEGFTANEAYIACRILTENNTSHINSFLDNSDI